MTIALPSDTTPGDVAKQRTASSFTVSQVTDHLPFPIKIVSTQIVQNSNDIGEQSLGGFGARRPCGRRYFGRGGPHAELRSIGGHSGSVSAVVAG